MAQNIQSYVPGIRELKLEEPMDASLTPGNHTESAAQNTANAEVEGFLKSVLEDFAASYSYFRGFVKGRQQLEDAINGFKTISNLDFVIREAQPSPLNDGAPSPPKIFWKIIGNSKKPIHIKDKGLPFRVDSSLQYNCPYGPQRKDVENPKRYCRASIYVKEIRYFPQHGVAETRESSGGTLTTKELKAAVIEDLQKDNTAVLDPESVFYLAFPKLHNNHSPGDESTPHQSQIGEECSVQASNLQFASFEDMEKRLEKCGNCCDQYHCPYCPDVNFVPRPRVKVVNHLRKHWETAMFVDGVKIMMCRNLIDQGQKSHFHCLCTKVYYKKKTFTSHIKECGFCVRGLQLDGPGNEANAFANDAMDTQPAIGRPTYGSTPVYSILGKRMKDDPSNCGDGIVNGVNYSQSELERSLSLMQQTKTMCDLVIRMDRNITFCVHRLLFCALSAMIKETCSSLPPDHVTDPNAPWVLDFSGTGVSPQSMSDVIDYVYGRNLNLDTNRAGIRAAAELLGMPSLVALCNRNVEGNMKKTTVVRVVDIMRHDGSPSKKFKK